MPKLAKFILWRFLQIPLTFFLVTFILYSIFLAFPGEYRLRLFLTSQDFSQLSSGLDQELIDELIETHQLNDPFYLQYARWLGNIAKGDWGHSGMMRMDIKDAYLRFLPATIELLFYSVLFTIPLSILGGVLAGYRQDRPSDFIFRFLAFVATSFPTFILAFILLAVFYVILYWFQPERISDATRYFMQTEAFRSYTGLITLDGILNGRLDITMEAARHLVLPVLTLSFAQWATTGRVTRAAAIDEKKKEYSVAARARGVSDRNILWRHILPNILSPALTSSALTSASMVTMLFVVEIIFDISGMSSLIVYQMGFAMDVVSVMAFTIFSVMIVMIFMFVLDVCQAIVDPRIREEVSLS
ncbi:MAG: ABC transporter permease [Anaerolineaceae bacterium]|nr:ABC transporter permease [Anaerolineaceae bacterium]